MQESQWQSHYPRPSKWEPHETPNPIPLLPIYPPPEDLIPLAPRIPSRSTSKDLTKIAKLSFQHSSHLIPACFLRSSSPHPLPEQPTSGLTREQRSKNADDLVEMVLNARFRQNEARTKHQPGQLIHGYPCVLWNCVDRFVRAGGGTGDITLLLLPSNGFSKEIWEPFLEFFLQSPEVRAQVGEIWSFEAVHHGNSAIINKNALASAGFSCWEDQSRDIVQFLTHFLPSQSSSLQLPTILSPVSLSVRRDRLTNGLSKNRRVVTLGHSWGGTTAAFAALHFPALFSSLILTDPGIQRPRILDGSSLVAVLVKTALLRRSVWTSREEAAVHFSRIPFFRSWHPAVLQNYLNHSLYVSTDGKVHLKTTPLQESIVFSEAEVAYVVWHMLPSLDKDIALYYVMPGEASFGLDVGDSQQLVWLRPNNCSNIKIAESGHLIPQEKPEEYANVVKEFLLNHYGKSLSKM
ncbi:Alpha/beta hydrolase family-domain-containing protein [Flagelloscypha sp. PMI_526]|nr:Alpha/beta hydrolase family-domain-containing protein [Flagelloscypha sp. PMI_526]